MKPNFKKIFLLILFALAYYLPTLKVNAAEFRAIKYELNKYTKAIFTYHLTLNADELAALRPLGASITTNGNKFTIIHTADPRGTNISDLDECYLSQYNFFSKSPNKLKRRTTIMCVTMMGEPYVTGSRPPSWTFFSVYDHATGFEKTFKVCESLDPVCIRAKCLKYKI